jgi:hypothetical protein
MQGLFRSTSYAGKQNAKQSGVLRRFAFATLLTFCWAPLQGATLERLSLEDMAVQATAIVRGKVLGSAGQFHGPVIYTHYRFQVTECYKGSAQGTIDVAAPGGMANGVRQSVAGSSELAYGEEYVLLLWAGKSGMNQIMGLTQGLFAVPKSVDSDPTTVRHPSTELMLDRATGQAVRDERLSLRLSELRSRISGALARGGGK